MRKLKQYTVAGAAALTVAIGGTGLAVAASAPGASQPAGDVHACVKSDGSVDFLQFRPENYGKCATGDAAWTWARTDGTTPAATTFGVGQVKVDGTTWAQYDAAELGAPGGDGTSGTVRFTCHSDNGCNVSLSAYSTATKGWAVYPRILLYKEDNTSGDKQICEYADGSTNSGATTPLTGTAATVQLGVGGTFDCGSTVQTGSPGASVDHINVPGDSSGEGLHYDVFTTLTFVKTSS
jgi:hypothetical protein